MADTLFLLPDDPLSPAGWLPQGSALVTVLCLSLKPGGAGRFSFA
jgi:hypothetical protein